MFKAWFVIILFFVGATAGILEWLADFQPYYSFASRAKSAEATAAYKSRKPGEQTVYLGEARYQFPLRFKTESGREVVVDSYYRNTYVPRRVLDVLERSGHVAVLYLPDDPQSILFEGDVEKLPRGYGALAWGLACLVIGALLVRFRYRLAGYTKYLRPGDGE